MKTIVLFLTLFLTQCTSKQNETINTSENMNKEQIGQNQQEYQFKLKKVTADSRCPEGLNCVWEGQVEMVVSVYKENELVEEKELIVNSQTTDKNVTWANQYSKKKITFIGVLPKRVKDQEIKESEYKLVIK
ncbi:hypothetical protein [Flavobacterium sp. J27]|uniref:hypothetical protein n=1 Tax=Flavobacterium sp. J27 TaxID=2060419 RepID=UPI00103234B7|nr:hypothetical protein [Flavobacterium sp. J27]